MIKIDDEEVEFLTKKNDEYSLDLYSEIKGCIEDLNHLKQNYISTESQFVIQICESYFENLKVLPFTLNELNKYMKKANETYTEQDSNFLQELKKEELEEEIDDKDLYQY
jgi:hypothetical protein